jgi:hypothetical protein
MTGTELKKLRQSIKETQQQFYVKRLGYANSNYGSRLEAKKNKPISKQTERILRLSGVIK